MALQFAVSNSAPKPGLYAGQPPARSPIIGEWPRRRYIAASILFHLLILFGIFLLPRAVEPLEVPVPLVTLILDESGAAGSAGGRAGGGGGGSGTVASSTATPQQTTQQQPIEQRTAEAATEPSPPEKSEPTPPSPTPPVPEASPLPPAPQGLAPPPKPHPRPVVRRPPPAAKPPPPIEAKPAETKPVERPMPLTPPQVATQPPPGPSAGQGAAAQNPQPGTAATGTANAGPGGATGVGTGAAGAGRGAFGSGKGAGDDYLDRLYRHLLKYKRTPPDAIARRQEGTVRVSMIVARNGTVLDAQISNSSGFPLLDQAILDMVHSASPVPPLPPEVPGDTAKVGLRFTFTIGVFDRIFH